ncbi:bone morphogenetic protein 10-like [Dunckerocampus dactyliophorus]|uniref:bone morphogenetic protein 10-like n=1 Tax=Dunckerocampus dactyliophorus TaxID=161453 RepID=UPI00240574A3|nr:bone morphogenetic protein 10-like [Dunckerocampus dactyliophorus]
MTLPVIRGLSSILSLSVLLVMSSCSPIRRDDTLLHSKDFLSHFLSTLNITGQRTPGKHLASPGEPPEYMLELYERYANDQSTVSSANIVRSFRNEDFSLDGVALKGVRTHPLLFNISVPHHEDITIAELRLFTLVRWSHRHYIDCQVTIYKVHDGVVWTREVGKEGRRRDEEEDEEHLEELLTKNIHAKDNSWVSFDLTHAVALWRKSGYVTHKLEVQIAILGPAEAVTRGGEVVIDTEGQHNAVMVVFSDDPSKRHKQRGKDLADQQPQLTYHAPPRIRRNVKSEPCKRTPLFVDFKDIGWDTWIIQPAGYEAYMCNGVCGASLTPELSPTKHAIVQTLLSVKSPERASRACCVPTKLEPISLLYHDNGVITFNHKYEGMVVAECGCR